MTKVKQGVKAMDRSPTAHLKAVKNNPIHKKKSNKFANTPTGKVRLVNGKKVQNNTSKENHLNSKQKQKKEVVKDSPDSPDSNNTSPKNNEKKNSPQQILNVSKTKKSPNVQSGKNKKKPKKNLLDEEEVSDESLEDINEGIVLPEDSIISQDDDDDDDDDEADEEESDTNLPNILGQSLADDTDEDDSDFDEEEDDEDEDDHDSDEEHSQLKGVKMFKGLLKQKLVSNKKKTDEDEDEDEDDADDDEDENDADESNFETDISMSSSGNKKGNVSVTEDEEEDYVDSEDEEDEDEDEDEEEEEEEEEDDEEESTPGLKDLLGNSIMDDDESDEDFEGEDEDDEDIDISDEESEADAKELEKESRTIYIGNIPKETKMNEIRQEFKKFGPIESMRIRGIMSANSHMSKKVAAIKRKIHPKVDSFSMYIVYKNEESALKALCMNGKKFKGYYLRVDTIKHKKEKPDNKKAVFLGNLSFTINNNTVWEHFKQCGEIDSVRLIKDKKGIGKGVGYVNFKSEDSVPLALELNGSMLLNREVRVKRCSAVEPEQKPKQKRNKRSHSTESEVKQSPKKLKVNKELKTTTSPVDDGKKKSKGKKKLQSNSSPDSEKKKTVFQGQKAIVGKKAKKPKLDKKKKKMAAILTAKPKKVQKV